MCGIAYGISCHVLFCISSIVVKYIYIHNKGISVFEILYWKSLTMMVFNYFLTRSFGVFVFDIPVKYRNIIVFRACIGITGVGGYWAAIQYIPLSVAACIIQTTPIWASILSYFLLKEAISKYQILAMISAFAGVIVVNDPFNYGKNAKV